MKKNYSNTAALTELSVGVGTTDGTITVNDASGYPDAPFTIVIDPDNLLEEACLVTSKTGTTFTVDRGWDGTALNAHLAGAVVKHAALAEDFREANGIVSGGYGAKTWQWLAEK